MRILQSIRKAVGAMASFVSGGYELLVRPRGSSSYPINEYSILTYAPIWYSTCKIGGHIAQIPRALVKHNLDETKTTITPASTTASWPGRLFRLCNLDPNGLGPAADLFETGQKDAIISGNGRLAVLRRNGEPVQLVRLDPARSWCFVSYPDGTTVNLSDVADNGSVPNAVDKWHYTQLADGTALILPDRDVIHIKGLQHDGLTGIPLYDVAADSLGSGKTAEAHTNRLFANDAIPGLILEAPYGVLNDPKKATDFLNLFREQHTGDNAGNIGLLRFGVTANQLSHDNRASQLLENRQFTRDEAWLWTGDIQFYSGADNVYRNGQELETAYKAHTLGRWCLKWEQELSLKLLSQRQRDLGWLFSVDPNAILRGSLETQAGVIQTLRATNTISEEQSRRMIGMAPARVDGENYDNPNTSSPEPAEPSSSSGDEPLEPAPVVDSRPAGYLPAPAPDNVYPADLDRDEWIYRQYAAGELTLAQIIEAMPGQCPDWELIGTEAGLRKAARRYADFQGLPRINRNIPSVSPATV